MGSILDMVYLCLFIRVIETSLVPLKGLTLKSDHMQYG